MVNNLLKIFILYFFPFIIKSSIFVSMNKTMEIKDNF